MSPYNGSSEFVWDIYTDGSPRIVSDLYGGATVRPVITVLKSAL